MIPVELRADTALEWQRCRDWLLKALARAGGTHTEIDLIDMVMVGQLQFWPGEKAAALTEIVVYPRLKCCHWFLVGGDMKELVNDIAPRVEDWARLRGCRRMTGYGRGGWVKVLKDYKQTGIIVAKELDDG